MLPVSLCVPYGLPVLVANLLQKGIKILGVRVKHFITAITFNCEIAVVPMYRH